MKKIVTSGIVLAVLAGCASTQSYHNTKEHEMEATTVQSTPSASQFIDSPLRNRITLALHASVPEVWAFIGDPGRMPEYSAGLRKVDTKYTNAGACTEYTCRFLPMEEGGQEIVHKEIIKWYEPNRGWASSAEEPNAFGLQQSFGLITLKANGNTTIMQWDVHFTAENEEMIAMNVSGFEQSLNTDIAQRLVQKFGGTVLESYVEGKK